MASKKKGSGYIDPSQRFGRPTKMWDEDIEDFEKLCALNCTEEEIASWFNVSVDTLERWCVRTYKMTFAEIFAVKKGRIKVSLRRDQLRLAKTSPAMAIFLGKNLLGQRDVIEEVNTDAIDKLDEILEGVRANAAASVQPETDDVHSDGE